MLAIARGIRAAYVITITAISLASCAVFPGPPNESVTSFGRGRSAISQAEITSIWGSVENAYDIVERVRPLMLVVRDGPRPPEASVSGPTVSRRMRVYIDDVIAGDVEMLRTVPKGAIIRVQWLSPIEATTRYGGGNPAGVIAVTTGPRR